MVAPVRRAAAGASPSTRMSGAAVAVKVFENDPAMKVTVAGRSLSIEGVASNRGSGPSVVRFTVAGHDIDLDLKRGTTPEQVLAHLAQHLPAGYAIDGGVTSFRVVRTTASGPRDAVAEIDAIFSAATEPGSPGKRRVTVGELRKAIDAGLESGGRLSLAERQALARNWAGLFDGTTIAATPAAQRAYAALQAVYALPVIAAD
ncbi:MAG: hypothetical protein IPJ65_29025 [Archangiaceae bacterium]|nr:hypothetical protein [Archangiaceae bacterium]